ncbi:MAG: putative phage-related protein [Proteobacteria bacterium]|nr:putative phage-related protein [Pseudomonadota bacterium]
MPVAAPRPCRHQGCGVLVCDGSGYCSAHQADSKAGKFADERRGSRHERGYGSAWEKLRKIILRRDKGLCQECLRQDKCRPAKIVDHKVPKFEGGTDDEDNLQSLCQSCSDKKTQSEAQRARQGRGV